MALSNDEKRTIRAQVAAYLGDLKNDKCYQDAKPEAKEYYAFIALRLVKKLRLEKDITKGDPIPTKAEAKPEGSKVLNAMDLRPDLKAAKVAQAKAKEEAKAVKAMQASANALVEEMIAKPKAKATPKARVSQKAD
jgi:hypothetical protein